MKSSNKNDRMVIPIGVYDSYHCNAGKKGSL